MKNNNNNLIKFELTPILKKSKVYLQIYTERKGDMKKVLDHIVYSESNKFTDKDLKVLKINKKKLKEIIAELEMMGIVKSKNNETKSAFLKLEMKKIKESMKKYKKRLSKKGINNYKKAIDRREKEIKKLR